MQKRHILAIALAMSMTFGMYAYAEESIVVETEAIVEESVVIETEPVVEESVVGETEVIETEAATEESIVAETEYVEELLDAKAYKGVEAFVAQLYRVCLGREPDAVGLADWSNKLTSKQIDGVSAAYGFVFSPEFISKNLCNEDYVKQLYSAFLGRKPDAVGLADWVSQLANGTTREEIFNGFAMSQEFKGLCDKYGIDQGTGIAIPPTGTIPNGKCAICGKEESVEIDGVKGFVQRLYRVCLNRNADPVGLEDWCNKLRNYTATGRSVAYGFIFSQEFIGKNYNNSDYVEYLYQAFMGRSSDPVGKQDWLNRMARGWTRQQVFDGFVGSQEFTDICNSYGIIRDDQMIPAILGTYDATFDAADVMVEGIDESMRSEGLYVGISFGDYMDEFKYVIVSEFKKDGTYKQYVNMESLRTSFNNMKTAFKLYMEDMIFEVLKQSINDEDPWAHIRSKKDLENYFGMTYDQIVYEVLGMNLETYVNMALDESLLYDIEAESRSEGRYKAQNGRLHLSASLNTNIDESVYETYTVNGNVVTITGGVNVDNLQNEYVTYPFTMVKRAN